MEERARPRTCASRDAPQAPVRALRESFKAAVALLVASGVVGALASCDGGDGSASGAPPASREEALPQGPEPAVSPDGVEPAPRTTASPQGRAARPAGDEDMPGDPDETPLPVTAKALADLLLTDEPRGEREAEARGALADHGAAAVPELIRLLASERHAGWACVCLQKLGAAAAPAASALAGCVASDAVHRGAATWALVCIGRDGAIAALPLVASEDPEVRCAALDTIGHIRWVPPESEKTLLAAVRDLDLDVRRVAAYALRAVSDSRAAAVGALFTLLRDDDGPVRSAAFSVLEKEEAFAEEIRSRAGELVTHAAQMPDDARSVASVLAALGTESMLLGLGSASADVRATLASYSDPHDDAIRARLTELLDDASPQVVRAAFRPLAWLDEPPAGVARIAAEILASPRRAPPDADLVEMLSEIHLRKAAVAVVVGLVRRGERPVEALLPSLEDSWEDVREAAAVALARSASDADRDRVFAAVRPLWRVEIPGRFAVELAAVVGARQGRGSEATAWLVPIADRGNRCRTEAITALGGIDDPVATETLLGQLEVVTVEVRAAAVAALGGHVTRDPRVVPALVNELGTAKRPEVRAAAAKSLASDRGRPEVRSALEAARRDRSSLVRDAAVAALAE